jgi:hypothetical protein
VHDNDLPEVFSAVDRVAANRPVVGLELTAKGLQHSPWGGHEVTSINVEKRSELSALQNDLLAALRPYSTQSGGRDSFVAKAGEPPVGDETIDYVSTFAAKHTGDKYEPHITVGMSDAGFADELQAGFKEPLRFKTEALAIYQLGNGGTARKKLWQFSPR